MAAGTKHIFVLFVVALFSGCTSARSERTDVVDGFNDLINLVSKSKHPDDIRAFFGSKTNPQGGAELELASAFFSLKVLEREDIEIVGEFEDGNDGAVVLRSGKMKTNTATVLMEYDEKWRLKRIFRPGAAVPELWSKAPRSPGRAAGRVEMAGVSWEIRYAYGFYDAANESLEVVLRHEPLSLGLLNKVRSGGRILPKQKTAVLTFQNEGSSYKWGNAQISSVCLNILKGENDELLAECRPAGNDEFHIEGRRVGNLTLHGRHMASFRRLLSLGELAAPIYSVESY